MKEWMKLYEEWCESWYDDTLLRVYPRKNNTDNKTEVKTMDKNKTPNEIEGTYMVTINGNETLITPVGFEDAVHFYGKNRDKSKSYKCHPDDKFDAGWVLNDYLEHKDEILVTDKVTVVDHGWCYPTARDWIVTFANAQRDLGNTKLANDILLDWGGRLSNYDSGTFRVVDSAVFEQTKEVYLIVNEQNKKYFLIDRKGLKKVQ
jgi:hypothetical protein